MNLKRNIWRVVVLAIAFIVILILWRLVDKKIAYARSVSYKAPVSDFTVIEPYSIKSYAWRAVEAKFGATEWNSFDRLVMVESGWNHLAINPSSGACGIPQSLPCSKLGENWKDPYHQIDWMIEYIYNHPNYGTPTKALQLQQSRNPHWY